MSVGVREEQEWKQGKGIRKQDKLCRLTPHVGPTSRFSPRAARVSGCGRGRQTGRGEAGKQGRRERGSKRGSKLRKKRRLPLPKLDGKRVERIDRTLCDQHVSSAFHTAFSPSFSSIRVNLRERELESHQSITASADFDYRSDRNRLHPSRRSRERERRPQSLLPAFTACESHSRRPSRVRVPALYSLTCVLQGMRRTATCCCPADCLALDVRRSLIVHRRPPPLLLPCLLPAFR